jgi:hypothetical protein
MAVTIAIAGVAAPVLFILTARRTRDQRVLLDLTEEAASDVPVAWSRARLRVD